MSLNMRLVAYEPNGPRLGVLPDPLSIQVGYPLNDLSSLTVDYPSESFARGVSVLSRQLEAGLEIAVEVTNATSWFEPLASRFVLVKRATDLLALPPKKSLTLPSYAWMLKKARNLKTELLNTDNKRIFGAATAGLIMKTLIDECKDRGTLPGLSYDFTSQVDSAGAAWTKVLNIQYEPGIDLFTILSNLSLQGVCDYSIQGRTLKLWETDTALGVDRTVGGSPVTLRLNRDIVAAPQEESLEEVISNVLITGDGGLVLKEDNPTAPQPWGEWEGFITQGGVSEIATARQIMQANLDAGARIRGAYTRELVIPNMAWTPLVDFSFGDYILAPGGDGSLERLRVRQVTLSKDSNEVKGNVTLNDRLIERDLRTTQRINGIVGGSNASGGSGALPAPEGPDTRVPAAPKSLILATSTYLDAIGTARGTITASWIKVREDELGAALDVGSYQIWGRLNSIGTESRQLTTISPQFTSITIDDFNPGDQWVIKVRATNINPPYTEGLFSDEATVTVQQDTEPPPKPSTPTVASRLGTLTVSWNGKTSTGTDQPRDFDHSVVYQMIGGVGVPVGTLYLTGGQDSLVITGLTYNEDTTFYIKALDRVGNESVKSDNVTGKTVANVDAFMIGQIITNANIVNVSGDKINPFSIETTKLQVGSANRIADGNFANADLNTVRTTTRTTFLSTATDQGGFGMVIDTSAGNTWLGTSSLTVANPPVPWVDVYGGQKYFANMRVRNAASTGTGVLRFVLQYTPPGGALTTVYSDSFSITSTAFTVYTASLDVPDGVTRVAVGLNRPTASGVATHVSTVGFRPQVGGTLIEAGSITTEKIAALAISADKINANAITSDKIDAGAITAVKIQADAIDATRLAAGAITAKHTITGAVIQTTSAFNTGVKLNADGLIAYTSAGVISVSLPTNSTEALFRGSIRARTYYTSGFESGSTRYIEMGDVGGTEYNDEMRFRNSSTICSIRNVANTPGTLRLNASDYLVDISTSGLRSGKFIVATASGSTSPTIQDVGIAGKIGMYVGTSGATSGIFFSRSTDGSGHVLVGSDSVQLKLLNGSARAQIRNSADNGYGELEVGNLIINGAQSGGNSGGITSLNGTHSGSWSGTLPVSGQIQANNGVVGTGYGTNSSTLYLYGGGSTNNGILAYSGGGSSAFMRLEGAFYCTGPMGTGGSKPFTIRHPLYQDMMLSHFATESPQPGTEYYGESQLDGNGHAIIELPAYYEALNHKDLRTVQLTPIGDPVALAAGHVHDGQFSVYGPPDTGFFWHVKSHRGDIAYKAEASRYDEGVIDLWADPALDTMEEQQEAIAAIQEQQAITASE